ncbi:phage tail tube protein [Magnetospirillum gryphiswaldense]|uniref:phage tail tube protein n=1 Tax=Magnetospirillum gryphiswaldense TaxID=55518 RepID=UPI003BB64545
MPATPSAASTAPSCSTTAAARRHRARRCWGQSTAAACASPPYTRLSFKECALGAERPLGYDPLLGQGRDAQDPYYEAVKDEGDVGVPLDVRALGFWLKGLFGAPATADIPTCT